MKRIFVYIGLLLSLTAWSQSMADKQKDAYWTEFRNALPNPYQTIGFAAFDDHSQLYIISEPPKDITLDQIEEVFFGYLYDIGTRKWSFGADGWVKDVVVTVDFAPDSCEQDIIMQLNQLLYGYSDQALYQQLPFKRERELFLQDTLDLHIHASSLYGWFVEDDMLMEDFRGNKKYFTQICNQPKNAVYRSSEPGFVVWTLPRGGTIGTKDKNFRKFTLNSDMIIGAIASSKTVCILGRERETDLFDLPPLRSEEVALLAWAPKSLNQSFYRTGFVTGKLPDNTDWCPAYLSDELNNTEVGHLLTLVDFFMKNWLRGGSFRFNGYIYPAPQERYEGGLDTIKSVRYNWNTDGVYRKTNYAPYSVFSLRNTACLNCSLFDASKDEETSLMDRQANAYLASVNNVDLFRVAQYFALYEIFKEYGIKCPTYKRQPYMDKSSIMVSDARKALYRLRGMKEEDCQALANNIAKDHFNNLYLSGFAYMFNVMRDNEAYFWENKFKEEAERNAYLAGLTPEAYKLTPAYQTAKENYDMAFAAYIADLHEKSEQLYLQDYARFTCDSIRNLVNAAKAIPESDIEGFCKFCADPYGSYSAANHKKYKKYEKSLTKTWCIWHYGPALGIDLTDVKNHYQNYLLNDTSMWFKNPKVVSTNNFKGIMMGADGRYRDGNSVGGHSISAKVEQTVRIDEPRQEKHTVSHYQAPRQDSRYTTIDEIASESEKAAAALKNKDKDAYAAHQRNFINSMPKEIRPSQPNKNDPTYQVLVREAKRAEQQHREATRQNEKNARFANHQTRTLEVIKQQQQQTRRYTQMINTLAQQDYQGNAQLIQKLENQRDRVANLNPPTYDDLEKARLSPSKPQKQVQGAEEEGEEEEDDYWEQYIKNLEKQLDASEKSLEKLETKVNYRR